MVDVIIHTASLAAVGIGTGMSQLPGSDMPLLMGLQSGMITEIAKCYGHSINNHAAVAMIATFAAGVGGRFISQLIVGWIPGFGNAINGATAGLITETIGWNADDYFKNLP
jgi:uncharacterized protein (DUF697 family)